MQKKIIALAIAAAFSAPAFADVTVYGIVDAAVANVSNSGQKSQVQAVSGGLSTSRLGVVTVEDVGDGVKVIAKLEYGLDSETSSTIGAARQQLLGVAGSFGTVATGYLQTAGYDWAVKYDPTAGSTVSPLQNMTTGNAQFLIGTKATATRAQRALAYISPDLGGVTVALNYVTAFVGLGNLTVANTAADVNITATVLSVNYAAGPLSVGGVYASTSHPAATSTTDEKEYALGASYDLGVAKLFTTYQSTKNNTAGTAGNSNKLYSLSGVIPAGPGAVAVSYAKAKIGTAAVGTDANGASYTLAYLYGLSKTSTIYGAFSKASNGSGTNAFSVFNSGVAGGTSTLGASSTEIAVGLKKVF